MDSNDAQPLRPLTPRELLLAEVPSAISLWECGRDVRDVSPEAARDLLALWAGLRRLAGDELGGESEQRLDNMVRADLSPLAERVLYLGTGFAAKWRDRLNKLWRDLDAAEPDRHDDLAWTAQVLFDDLDRLQLAAWTADKLLAPDASLRGDFSTRAHELIAAEGALFDRSDLFVDRFHELAAVLADARPGLEQTEPDLWVTLLKFRRVQEEQEAVETPPARQLLLRAASPAVRSRPRAAKGWSGDGRRSHEREKHMFPVVITKEFNGYLRDLLKAGGRGRDIATKVRAAQTEAHTEGEIKMVSRTRHGESRLPDVEKYDLGDGYRLVVQRVESSTQTRAFLFCGKHDDAESWLERHKDYRWVRKPSDRTLEFVQVSRDESPTAVFPVLDLLCAPALLELPLLRHLDNAEWKRLNLPAAAASYTRSVTAAQYEQDATGVVNHLEAVCESVDQALLVSDLLVHAHAGEWGSLHRRIELLTGVAMEATSSEAAEAMTALENSEQFVSWEDAKDLPLDGDWADWMLFLHPEQKELAKKDLNGAARLRGVSGSGKTCVMIHRARYLARKYQQPVLLVTLTTSMRNLLDALIRRLCGAEAGLIHLWTVSGLAKELINQFDQGSTWRFANMKDAVVMPVFRHAVQLVRGHKDFVSSQLHRLPLNELESFLFDEINYVRSRLLREDYDRYLSAKTFVRLGRGRGLSEEGRRVCLDAIRSYDTELEREEILNPEGVVQTALGLLKRRGGAVAACRWRCVLVDEVQDLSQMEMSLLANLLTPDGERIADAPNGLFLVGDGAQTIYKRGFRLSESGVNVAKRSFAFRKNYRNTKDVLTAAYGLIRAYEFADVDEDHVATPLQPDFAPRYGEKPLLVKCNTPDDEMRFVATQIHDLLQDRSRAATAQQVGVIAANQDVRDAVGHALDDLHVSWTTLKEDSSPTADVVKISTIESAKGHEFTHVFIPGLAEGILPREVPEDDMSREAARLYVAMTRARDYLCLSYTSDSRYRPSRFLAALQADCTEFVWNGYFLQPIE